MDLDAPKGYSPCWLDESPPKPEDKGPAAVKKEPTKPVQPKTPQNISTWTSFLSNNGAGGSSSAKNRVKRSPFYTASPLGASAGKVVKNSFFRRLRSSHSDKESEDDFEFGSKSTGWRKRHGGVGGDSERQHSNRQYGGNHLFLPFVLMGYLQVIFNGIIIAGILYFIVQFALTIRRDVDLKVDEQLSHIMSEIQQCSRQYIENRCSPELRVPAMEKACSAWEACMKRDPSTLGRAKLSAETFAEVINSLIDPISYKTMMFILLGVFGTMFASNYAFNAARNRGAGSTSKFSTPFTGSTNMTPLSPFATKTFASRSLQNVPT